ncbi:MAG: alpha/beta hydrolase [Gammaproteobacteria bacterium]|nr:MAG: alpha/beta hydrolase [Gammaproteobacteria bacterium]
MKRVSVARMWLYGLVAVLALAGCEAKPPPAAERLSGSVVSADGVPIKYEVSGAGEPALVFVHCWTCNRQFWDEQVSYFERYYRVVRLDLAGHGESGKGRKNYTMAAFGADVAAVAEQLGLKQVVLVGHSMGGPVSAEAEKRLGKSRVLGVVGVDTFHTGFPLPKNDKEVAAFVKPFEDDFRGYGEKFMRGMFTPQSDPALINRIGGMVLGSDKTMAVSALKNILAWYRNDAASSFDRLGERLRNINADPLNQGRPLHRSVVLVGGVGHFVAQEKPAEFNRALQAVVTQLVNGTSYR